jgi:hypothetical protein
MRLRRVAPVALPFIIIMFFFLLKYMSPLILEPAASSALAFSFSVGPLHFDKSQVAPRPPTQRRLCASAHPTVGNEKMLREMLLPSFAHCWQTVLRTSSLIAVSTIMWFQNFPSQAGSIRACPYTPPTHDSGSILACQRAGLVIVLALP